MGMISNWIWRMLERNEWTRGLRYGRAFLHLGKPSPVALPKELIKIGIPTALRAVLTNQSVPVCLDWVLPFWMERQFKPESMSFLPRAFNPITFNLTERNWSAVGNLDSAREAIVDPRGLLTPFPEAWSLDVWLYADGGLIAPSKAAEAEQKLAGHAPRVITRIQQAGLALTMEAWAGKDRELDITVEEVRVENRDEVSRSLHLYFSVRPFNPEGIALVHDLSYEAPGLLMVNNHPGVVFLTEPEIVSCSNYREGDVSFDLPEPSRRDTISCPTGLATGIAGWKLELEPGASQSFTALVFMSEGLPHERARAQLSFDPSSERSTSDTRWQERLSRGMQLSLPEKRLNDCFETCRKYLLLLDDGDIITPGPFTYHHFWFRDSAYMVYALDMIGHHDLAARKLSAYPSQQRKDGYYLSQDGEWDAPGQGIWPVVEHYRITHDLKLLAELYPSMNKSGEWIIRTVKKSRRKGKPHAGLMPAGFSAEHFGPNDYFFWDNFWCLAGLRDLAFAAKLLGYEQDHDYFKKEFERYWADVERAMAYAEDRLGKKVIPSSPYRRVDSAAVGVLAGVYPLGLFDADDPRIVNTISELRRCAFFEEGFIQHMIHSGVNAYLTLHIAECYLKRRSQSAWPLVNYLLDKSKPTWSWPEAMHPLTGGGCMGDGLHGWAAADWLVFLRNICFFEERDSLIITPVLPPGWLRSGGRLDVSNAPSLFGPVSFNIEFGQGEASLSMQGKFRNPPKEIEWNLPEYISKAWVDDKEIEAEQNRIRFAPHTRNIKLKF